MGKKRDREQEVKSQRTIFQEYSEAFVVAVILAIIIRAFFVQAFKIPSGSMMDTLLIGDHILVNKFVYGYRIPFTNARWPHFSSPKRGDVIVFVYPEKRTQDFIKRVVAVEGDTLEISNKRLIVNGEQQDEPYTRYVDGQILPPGTSPLRDNFRPITVPPGQLFVMGDNRDRSHDSRLWNLTHFVPVHDVKGKAFIIYYSAPYFPAVRWNRMFSLIH